MVRISGIEQPDRLATRSHVPGSNASRPSSTRRTPERSSRPATTYRRQPPGSRARRSVLAQEVRAAPVAVGLFTHARSSPLPVTALLPTADVLDQEMPRARTDYADQDSAEEF